eukprot:8905801-Karenia_brevis.AAC.1
MGRASFGVITSSPAMELLRPVASRSKKQRSVLNIPEQALVRSRRGREEVPHTDDVPHKFWSVLLKLGRAS